MKRFKKLIALICLMAMLVSNFNFIQPEVYASEKMDLINDDIPYVADTRGNELTAVSVTGASIEMVLAETTTKYEAEEAVFLDPNNDRVGTHVNAAGFIRHRLEGQYVEFPNVVEGNKLTLRYDTDLYGKISVYINGVESFDFTYPGNPGWGTFDEHTMDVDIPSGATIRIQRDAGDGQMNLDYIIITGSSSEPVDTTAPVEAENCAVAEGNGKLTVSFTEPADIDYSHAEISVVDHEGETQIALKGTQSVEIDGLTNGTLYTILIRTVDLTGNKSAGVTITGIPTIETMVRYEAEEGIFENPNGNRLGSNAEATGFLRFPNEGEYVEFTNVIGGSKLTLRYGTYLSGKLSAYINGIHSFDITYPAGNDWKFHVYTMDVSIPEGATIKLQRDAGDQLINVDYIEIEGEGPTGPDTTAPDEVTSCLVTPANEKLIITWNDPIDTDYVYTIVDIEGALAVPIIVPKGVKRVELLELTNENLYNITLKTADITGNISAGVTVTGTPSADIVETWNIVDDDLSDYTANWDVDGWVKTIYEIDGKYIKIYDNNTTFNKHLIRRNFSIPAGAFTYEFRVRSQGPGLTEYLLRNSSCLAAVYITHGTEGTIQNTPTNPTKSFTMDTTVYHTYTVVVHEDTSYDMYVDGIKVWENSPSRPGGTLLLRMGVDGPNICNVDVDNIKVATGELIPSGPPTSPAETVYEAEKGQLLGSAGVYKKDPFASGAQSVYQMDSVNDGVQINNVVGASKLRFRYTAKNSGKISVYINGWDSFDMDFEGTGAWEGIVAFGYAEYNVDIPAGSSIKVQFDEGDSLLYLDYIELSGEDPHIERPDPPVPEEPILPTPRGWTFYIDSISGDDNNDGKTPQSAWKTVGKVNSTDFLPGDSILFKSGCAWTGEGLTIDDSGIESHVITYGKYGDGPNPILNRQAPKSGWASYGVLLKAVSYVTVQDLEITNNNGDGESSRMGVYYFGTGNGRGTNIELKNLYIHNIDGISTGSNAWESSGIQSQTLDGFYLDNFLIENCNIYYNTAYGIYIRNSVNFHHDPVIMSHGLIIRGNTLSQNSMGDIIIGGYDSPLVEHNVGHDAGSIGKYMGWIAGMWEFNCKDAVFQYNEVFNIQKDPAHPEQYFGDGQAFDVDIVSRGTITFQYNYSHNNYGGTLLVMPNDNGALERVVFRYNISQNDHFYNGSQDTVDGVKVPSRVQMVVYGSPQFGSDIYNNVFYNDIPNEGFGIKRGINNTRYYNNIFYSLTDYIYPEEAVFSNNCYYGHNAVVNDPNKVTANPLFVKAGSGGNGINTVTGYKLQPNSPCINTGMVIEDNGGKDFWGNSLYNELPDIGVSELPYYITINDTEIGTGFNQFNYVGNWENINKTGAYNNDLHISSLGNDYYEVKFKGTFINLYASMAANHGIAAVSIDGGMETLIDFYKGNSLNNVLLFESPLLPQGEHTLKVRNTGTKNENSSGVLIPVDRVDTLSDTRVIPPHDQTPPDETIMEVTDNTVMFDGTNSFIDNLENLNNIFGVKLPEQNAGYLIGPGEVIYNSGLEAFKSISVNASYDRFAMSFNENSELKIYEVAYDSTSGLFTDLKQLTLFRKINVDAMTSYGAVTQVEYVSGGITPGTRFLRIVLPSQEFFNEETIYNKFIVEDITLRNTKSDAKQFDYILDNMSDLTMLAADSDISNLESIDLLGNNRLSEAKMMSSGNYVERKDATVEAALIFEAPIGLEFRSIYVEGYYNFAPSKDFEVWTSIDGSYYVNSTDTTNYKKPSIAYDGSWLPTTIEISELPVGTKHIKIILPAYGIDELDGMKHPRITKVAIAHSEQELLITKASIPINIDGLVEINEEGQTIGDWEGAYYTKLMGVTDVNGNEHGGNVYYKYDNENLYIGAKIKDPTPMVNTRTGTSIWNGDNLELFIGVEDLDYLLYPDKINSTIPSDVQFVFSGGIEQGYQYYVYKNGITSYPTIIMDVKMDADGKGYTIEAAIPLSEIGITEPWLGKNIIINPVLNDGSSSGRGQWGWTTVGEATKKYRELWGNARFEVTEEHITEITVNAFVSQDTGLITVEGQSLNIKNNDIVILVKNSTGSIAYFGQLASDNWGNYSVEFPINAYIFGNGEYTVTVGGRGMNKTNSITFSYTDTVVAEVTNLNVTEGNSKLIITWTDPLDNDFEHVAVSIEGQSIEPIIVDKGTQKVEIGGLTDGADYNILIKTVDFSGNSSTGITITGTPIPIPKISVIKSGKSTIISTELTAIAENENETGVVKIWETTINSLLESVKKSEAPGQKVIIDIKIIDPSNSDGLLVEIPRVAFNRISEVIMSEIKIRTSQVAITLDSKTIDNISNSERNGDISIRINKVDPSTLSIKMQKKVGSRPVFDFSIKVGSKELSNFGNGKVEISIPYTSINEEKSNSIIIYYIDTKGKLKSVR